MYISYISTVNYYYICIYGEYTFLPSEIPHLYQEHYLYISYYRRVNRFLCFDIPKKIEVYSVFYE